MTRKIKKGTKGSASKFLSRAKAIRKLDIPIKDFRKLCILKGVHPRVPKKKISKTHTTYYHKKDISFLMSDKTLNHFKKLKIYRRKLHRAIVKRDKLKILTVKEEKPKLDINHIIKERYPDFEEALRDLNDPLTLLSLICKFPGHRLFKINPEKLEICKRLLIFFKGVCVKEKLLEKVFLSVKGIYFQVRIKGNLVTWLEPYPFSQSLPFDVDYKVILSFMEFYQTFLKFVVFKLYKDFDLVYPPVLESVEDEDCFLKSDDSFFMNLGIEKVDKKKENEELMDSEELTKIKNLKNRSNKKLFGNLKFFLSREVNKELFEFCIKNFSGEVFYDSDNFDSETFKNQTFTHVVLDRDIKNIEKKSNTDYIQPQWIVDSINNNYLLPVTDYIPGKNLPAHLSPFVNNKKEGYIPDREKEILKFKGEFIEESIEVSSDEENEENNGNFETEEIVKKVETKVSQKKKYVVEKEKFDFKKEEMKKIKNKVVKTKEEGKLSSLMLSKKKKRLLEKIQKCDKKKKLRIKELIKKKRALKNKK